MRTITALFVLMLLPVLAFGQAETSGKITGIVRDESQKPIPGADITFESPALQGERTATTGEDGRFLQALLPPGDYLVSVRAPGKTPVQFSFRLGVNQNVPLDVVLRIGEELPQITEVVTVQAPASKLQTTTGGESFSYAEDLNFLPVTNRQIDVVANLAPNVSFGPTAGSLTISGAPSFDNAVLFDGSDISDPFYSGGTVVYLEEAIDELQVMTNGISARYGRFQGGVLNATTKSGGNTFDGSARIDLTKQSWNSQTPFGEDQADDLGKVYSATLGGPIIKDHLWFFVGARTIPATSTTATFVRSDFTGSFTSETNQDRGQVKLTGAINANHTLEASFLDYDNEVTNYDPFAWVAEPNAIIPVRKDPRKFYTAEYQGVLSDKLFLNAQLAKKDVSIQSGGDPDLPSPILEFFDGQYQAYANGWFDPNDPSVRNNESAALSLQHTLNAASWGNHTLEYGIQYVDSITSGDNRQSPTGFNLYLNQPVGKNSASFAECDPQGNCLFDMDSTLWFNERLKAIPGAGDQDLKNLALYAQDSWEIAKWRFDLGLRYEQWEGEAISPAMTLDFDAWSPRLGITYNITPDWQLQGTWGKYVARFADNVANGVSGISSLFGPGVLQEYIGPTVLDQTPAQIDALLRDDSNWGAILGFVDPLQPTTFFADDISAPYAIDTNLSIKRALPKSQGVVTVTYTRRDFEDLLEDNRGGLGVITVDLPDGSTSDVDRVVWDNCSSCRRDYEALTVGWDYRPGVVWDVGGNYTHSKTRGNYEGEANGQPAIGSIIGNYPNVIDAAGASPYGYLASDVRHRARAWGAYRFDLGRPGRLTLGGILFYRSGASFSKTARVDAGTNSAPDYSGAPSTYVRFFDGRGNSRFNGFWNLDTTVRYDFALWQKKDLGAYVKLDIVNITNNDELILFRTGGTVEEPDGGGVPTWQPNANFGTATNQTSYQTPRSYFIALGVSW